MKSRHGIMGGMLVFIAAATLAAGPGTVDPTLYTATGPAAEWEAAAVEQAGPGGRVETREAQGTERVRLVTAEQGNVARYRVREQLARLDFPNDAVGETRAITGAIELEADGRVVREASRFEVDLSALQSDSDRRDNFIRRRTLETETYPMAVFVPTEVRGLPWPVPTDDELEFEVVGEMTIRDVTRPITWQVTASADGGAFIGTARTRFTFGTFDLEIPRVASVLSIRDDIRLEYEFRLVEAGDRR